jgi:hypothetical protein
VAEYGGFNTVYAGDGRDYVKNYFEGGNHVNLAPATTTMLVLASLPLPALTTKCTQVLAMTRWNSRPIMVTTTAKAATMSCSLSALTTI